MAFAAAPAISTPSATFLSVSRPLLSSNPFFFKSLPRISFSGVTRHVSSSKKARVRAQTDSKVSEAKDKIPFGYTRKDVLLIGLGLTAAGLGLKSGLEVFPYLKPFSSMPKFLGVDSLKAGNVVQLVMVLGLTVGWISTYIFRVSTKDMTYAQQLRDYENKVMQKRLEEMPEAELELLLAEVEEEKRRLQKKN
eukprot:TRINITY_DN1533_c0_g1_i1.p1 TRINITY_DN1533_c0_g1~~TRINITY_DN1533_c0_g1_i1.p1  ORF type:complete len:193 (-),score=35.71 TRINITY_DN1533_c0_g1_i1:339-917(-)